MTDPRPRKKRDPFLAGLLGWLVPGLGHLYVGKKAHALVYFALIAGVFAIGLALGDFRNVYWSAERKFHYIAQVGCGGPTLVCAVGQRTVDSWKHHLLMPRSDGVRDRREDYGTLYTCVAGLLNMLVLVNAGVLAATGGAPLPVREEESS
jgi:hypothetical protein